MNRRDFLSTSTLATIAATTAGIPASAAQHSTTPTIVAQSRTVGATTVTTISDGYIPLGPELLSGVDADTYKDRLEGAHMKPESHLTGVNSFLVETGDKRILIDAGSGIAMGPTLGNLSTSLPALGVDPASITHLIATHLHPDHVGGVMPEGQNIFSNAELIVSQDDLAFWTNPDMAAAARDGFKPFFELATNVVSSFGDRIKPVSGEADLGMGLTTLPMPGHTPGHMGIMLEDNNEQLLIWGDIIHVAPVQLADPTVTIAFDTDGETAARTRARVMDWATTDKLMVAGAHMSFPSVGYLEKADAGYRWFDAPYPYGQ